MKAYFQIYIILTIITSIFSHYSYSQVNEIYVMTTNAYPRINETQKMTKANNDSLAYYTTNKSTNISVLCAVDYSLQNKFIIRANFYFQNKYNDRYSENNSTRNHTTYSSTLRKRKIYTTYFDILKRKEFNFAQIYYGAFIGGYYENPYQETSTYINDYNKIQTSKRLITYNINGRYALQTGLLIGVYFKIISNFKIGMEIRNLIAYQIANQTETTTITNYGANNNFIDRTKTTNETQSRILYYNLFNPYFSIKYTMPTPKIKSPTTKEEKGVLN